MIPHVRDSLLLDLSEILSEKREGGSKTYLCISGPPSDRQLSRAQPNICHKKISLIELIHQIRVRINDEREEAHIDTIEISKPLMERCQKHYYSGIVGFFLKCLRRLGLLKFEKISVGKKLENLKILEEKFNQENEIYRKFLYKAQDYLEKEDVQIMKNFFLQIERAITFPASHIKELRKSLKSNLEKYFKVFIYG